MGRKRILRVSKTAMVKCPSCDRKSRVDVKDGVYFFECKKCKTNVTTPAARCCIICAYSDKNCPAAIQRKAKAEGLKIKGMETIHPMIQPIQIH